MPGTRPTAEEPSKCEFWPDAIWSCQPWKWVRTRRIFVRPVAVRARRSASSVASVPEEVKRTFSAEGTIDWIFCAQRNSPVWLAPKCVPQASASATAAITSGSLWPSSSAPWPPK